MNHYENENQETENLAQTIAREIKKPLIIADPNNGINHRIALPPGWNIAEYSDEKLLAAPTRKTAKVSMQDDASFVSYIQRHGSLVESTIWCDVNYISQDVKFKAILNDHGEDPEDGQWRDHIATYSPRFSEEWLRWNQSDGKHFSQMEFAIFIEKNLKEIVSTDGSPSGSQMLEMALNFEANQDMRFKSAVRLQSGGINMSFVETDDAQTIKQMQVFERFTIGLPVFWNGDAYQVDARLRYRQKEGKLIFWHELIRQEKVLEDATHTLIKKIRTETGNPFFFGNPFLE